MSEPGPAIEFQEHSDADLPESLRLQVLSFLRIVWPDGFTGPNRFRDQITDPRLRPHHLLFAAEAQLVSHLEIITTTVTVNQVEYEVQSPTSVMTYPSFRGEGWSTRLNRHAAERIDNNGADVGVLMCSPELVAFYDRTGWTHEPAATVVAGPEGHTWESDDALLVRATSTMSARFLEDLRHHPMRVLNEW